MSVTQTASTSKHTAKTKKKWVVDKTPKDDLLDRFHPPDKKVCDIIATRDEEKVDPFFEFRPKTSKEYLDYNISQTEAKMDCGPTKIHYSQIRADYVKYPEDFVFPEKKRKKRSRAGRGPLWLYMDEVYRRKINKEQVFNKKALENRLEKKKMLLKQEKTKMIAKIIENALPDWFQELSNEQKRSADRLELAILKDLKQNTICNVQECIAGLGLVLRPNHHRVQKALKDCCKNPVEFLQSIYDFRGSDGSFREVGYSLNEKIVLSAIIHLILPMLLREMHIRVPSPPREPKEPPPKPPHRKKHVTYESPYLEPYTFEPDPPEHTGVYKNRHIQYPESPYFSYLTVLTWDREFTEEDHEESYLKSKSRMRLLDMKQKREFLVPTLKYLHPDPLVRKYDVLNALQLELNDERDCAQAEYDEMFKEFTTKKLMRASLYQKCIPEEIPPAVLAQRPPEESSSDEELTVSTFLPDGIAMPTPPSSLSSSSSTSPKNATKNDEVTTEGTVPVVNLELDLEGGTSSSEGEESEELSPYVRYPVPANVIAISGGITIDHENNTIPIIAGLLVPHLICDCNVKPHDSDSSLRLFKAKKYVCKCIKRQKKLDEQAKKLKERKREQDELCTCKVCSCKNKIPSTPSSVSTVPSFVPPSKDVYETDDTKGKVVEVKEPPALHCHCKELVEQYLEYRQKHENEGDPKKAGTSKVTFVVGDYTDDGEQIIRGIKAPKECRCVEKYRERIAKFRKQERIDQAQGALRSTNRTFSIGGVKLDADGKPIYMLGGVHRGKLCEKCILQEEAKTKEAKRLENMPVFPVGRVKYHISGVQQTPHGNVYIISGALKSEPCDCMNLWDNFTAHHSTCIQLYNRYMEKMKTDTREYLQELRDAQQPSSSDSNADVDSIFTNLQIDSLFPNLLAGLFGHPAGSSAPLPSFALPDPFKPPSGTQPDTNLGLPPSFFPENLLSELLKSQSPAAPDPLNKSSATQPKSKSAPPVDPKKPTSVVPKPQSPAKPPALPDKSKSAPPEPTDPKKLLSDLFKSQFPDLPQISWPDISDPFNVSAAIEPKSKSGPAGPTDPKKPTSVVPKPQSPAKPTALPDKSKSAPPEPTDPKKLLSDLFKSQFPDLPQISWPDLSDPFNTSAAIEPKSKSGPPAPTDPKKPTSVVPKPQSPAKPPALPDKSKSAPPEPTDPKKLLSDVFKSQFPDLPQISWPDISDPFNISSAIEPKSKSGPPVPIDPKKPAKPPALPAPQPKSKSAPSEPIDPKKLFSDMIKSQFPGLSQISMPDLPDAFNVAPETEPKSSSAVPLPTDPKKLFSDLLKSQFPAMPPPSLPPPVMSPSISPSSSTSGLLKSRTSSELSSSDVCICVKKKHMPTEEEASEESTPPEEEKPSSYKRYILLKKIPTTRNGQIALIKKLLENLAGDGYPLADLPGMYKLPHFRIWMVLRCRRFWTMDDRHDMLAYSKRFWVELEKCRAKVPTEKLNFTQDEARSFTWADSKHVKDLTNGIKERQHRRVKQSLIQYGRDYFPSMFDYELPTKTFRDVYFAYVPCKEESLFPRFPWAKYEYRNYNMMREKNRKKFAGCTKS